MSNGSLNIWTSGYLGLETMPLSGISYYYGVKFTLITVSNFLQLFLDYFPIIELLKAINLIFISCRYHEKYAERVTLLAVSSVSVSLSLSEDYDTFLLKIRYKTFKRHVVVHL